MLFLYLKRVFEALDKDILINKLSIYDIKNGLINRTQCVKWNKYVKHSLTFYHLCHVIFLYHKYSYPLNRVPFGRTFSTPPKSRHKMALLIYSCPWIEGAKDLDNKSKILRLFFTSDLHLATSSMEMVELASLLIC